MPVLEDFLLDRPDLSDGRKKFYRCVFKAVAKLTPKPFTLNRKEMNVMLEKLKRVYRTKQSWKGAVACIRVVYKWLNGGETYPDAVKHIKYPTVRREDQVKQKILTENEVRSLIEAADNPRDKAMVAVGAEGGFRLGELLSLTVGSCEKTSYGYDVTVTGKTGTRRVPIVVTAPLLEMWRYCHPAKNDKQAPLWTRLKGNRYVSIKPCGAHRMLKLLAKRVGMKKNVHWHMFRHTQATFYARNDVNEAKMRAVFGWAEHSKMPSVYTQLAGRDVQDTVLRLRGVQKVERKIRESIMAPRKCFRCGELNVFDALHCKKCGMVLDKDKAAEIVEKQKVMEEAYRLFSDPEVLEELRAAKERARKMKK